MQANFHWMFLIKREWMKRHPITRELGGILNPFPVLHLQVFEAALLEQRFFLMLERCKLLLKCLDLWLKFQNGFRFLRWFHQFHSIIFKSCYGPNIESIINNGAKTPEIRISTDFPRATKKYEKYGAPRLNSLQFLNIVRNSWSRGEYQSNTPFCITGAWKS